MSKSPNLHNAQGIWTKPGPGLVEKIRSLARREHRTIAETTRMLLELGMWAYSVLEGLQPTHEELARALTHRLRGSNASPTDPHS